MSVGGKSAAVYSHSCNSRFYYKISIMMTHAFAAVLLLSSLHTTCMRFFFRMGRRKIRIGRRHRYKDQKKRKPLSLMVSIPCCNLAVQVSTGLSLVQCSPQPKSSQLHCDSDTVSDLTVHATSCVILLKGFSSISYLTCSSVVHDFSTTAVGCSL